MTSSGAAALVLDEHLTAPCAGLQDRGIDARPVHDFRATSILDPDVIRAVAAVMQGPWVLATLDGSLVEDNPAFEWERYAIAWLVLDPNLKGVAVEHAKTDILHHHARRMVEQRPGDHFSYTERARHKHPPSLLSARQR